MAKQDGIVFVIAELNVRLVQELLKVVILNLADALNVHNQG